MEFTGGVAAFTAVLREEHGFGVGHAATRDALRAAEIVGVGDGARLRRALRVVYCATPDEVARFDPAFDAFFFGAQGIAQPNLTSRHTRPGRPRTPGEDEPSRSPRSRDQRPEPETGSEPAPVAQTLPVADEPSAAQTWQTLRARYSALAARSAPPPIARDGLDAMFSHVERLIARVRIARSRRRTPHRHGDRIDLRRTLRAGVETAGEPINLRRTARAVRSARFVLLIDGSRSTSEHAGPILQFAYALLQRSRRAHAFVFSTALCDVTAMLREPDRAGRALDDLGEAWGGGTRIGDNLLAFVQRYGARLLSRDTVVLVFSDGLDVGNLDRLDRAMRELRARSAAILWLHPHAASPRFVPSAGGLRVAYPYLTALYAAGEPADFGRLAARVSRGIVAGGTASPGAETRQRTHRYPLSGEGP